MERSRLRVVLGWLLLALNAAFFVVLQTHANTPTALGVLAIAQLPFLLAVGHE